MVSLKDVERRIRGTQRELVPLTTGLIVATRRNRTKRLRDCVRRRARTAIKLQAWWRGVAAFSAYRDPYRDAWERCFDHSQADKEGGLVYYYNSLVSVCK